MTILKCIGSWLVAFTVTCFLIVLLCGKETGLIPAGLWREAVQFLLTMLFAGLWVAMWIGFGWLVSPAGLAAAIRRHRQQRRQQQRRELYHRLLCRLEARGRYYGRLWTRADGQLWQLAGQGRRCWPNPFDAFDRQLERQDATGEPASRNAVEYRRLSELRQEAQRRQRHAGCLVRRLAVRRIG